MCVCLPFIWPSLLQMHPSSLLLISIYPSMRTLMPQRQTLKQPQQSPWATNPTWGPSGLMLYPRHFHEYTRPERRILRHTVHYWCSQQQDMTGSLGTDSELVWHTEPCHVACKTSKPFWTVSSCSISSICSVPNLLKGAGFDLPH